MLARDIRKHTSARAHPGPVIFDRDIADGLGYASAGYRLVELVVEGPLEPALVVDALWH